MSRNTKLLGTVSVLATLAAGPAAADQLMGFAGFVDATYSHSTVDNDSDFFGNTDTNGWNNITVGAGIAFPVDEIDALAWQLDGNYSSQSGDNATVCYDPGDLDTCFDASQSRIVWNFGGSLFLSFPGSRTGININYNTTTDFGSLTNGGLFTEWYFGNFTVAAKGGWLWGGGTPNGGRGNYLGANVAGYFVPNLYLGGSVTWADLISGSTGVGGGYGGPCFGPTCGRRDFTATNFTLDAEFLVSQTLPISIFGGYTFTDYKVSENVSNPNLIDGNDFSANTFFIGVRYYMGGMGSLIDMHRNGNLRPWLRGAN
jgi:hypothetical protein